jgi:2-polyprenyl-3-methyl-5-hydroxy-6-metoxy-1,4-benzoquinol methylase
MIAAAARENVYGHQKRLRFFLSEIENLAAWSGRAPGALRVLDVGCGTGVMVTRPLAERGYDVTGLDTDETSIARARNLNAGGRGLSNLRFVLGRLEEQRLDAPFDVIVCSEVLEHLPEPHRLLRAMTDRLADDGVLLVTVPNGFGLFEIDSHLYEALSRVPGFWRLPDLWLRGKARVLAATRRGAQALRAAEDEDRPERISSLTVGQPHCQVFTPGRAGRLFRSCGLRLVLSGRSSLWAGPFAHLMLRDFDPLIRLNCRLADLLPAQLASGLFFSLRKAGEARSRAVPRAVDSRAAIPHIVPRAVA